jgi:hypothetical protein
MNSEVRQSQYPSMGAVDTYLMTDRSAEISWGAERSSGCYIEQRCSFLLN